MISPSASYQSQGESRLNRKANGPVCWLMGVQTLVLVRSVCFPCDWQGADSIANSKLCIGYGPAYSKSQGEQTLWENYCLQTPVRLYPPSIKIPLAAAMSNSCRVRRALFWTEDRASMWTFQPQCASPGQMSVLVPISRTCLQTVWRFNRILKSVMEMLWFPQGNVYLV